MRKNISAISRINVFIRNYLLRNTCYSICKTSLCCFLNHTAFLHEEIRKTFNIKPTSYQEMTIFQFRENAVSFLDTPENMNLLQKALEDIQLQFHRFTDKNAFFICIQF